MVVAGVLLLACSGPTDAAAPPVTPTPPTPPPVVTPGPDEPTPDAEGRGGTLRIGITEPASLLPFEAVEPDELLVVDALFDALTRYEANFVVSPSAAQSWTHDDDGATWTFTLREGATFHDGSPVTADDFAFTWNLAVREGAAGHHHLRGVAGYDALRRGAAASLSGVEAVDERTLRVQLSAPHADFPAVVGHPALAPVPRERFRADPERFTGQPVGNGPFAAAEERVPGQFIRLQRAPEWSNAGAPAALDEVLFQILDPEAAFVAFQQGRLQVSPLPEGAVEAAVEQFGASPDGYEGPGVLRGPTATVYFLAFNVTQPPYDDPDVRRAISLALDRQAIADSAAGGHAEPVDAFVPPVLGGRAGACETCRHDPAEARRLLRERDEPVGSLTLWFNRDGGHRTVAEQVRRDLAAVGLAPVVFRSPAFDEYLEVLEGGEAGFFRYGWRPEYPLADDLLYPLFHSSQIEQHNYMRYASEDVDALLDDARESLGLARRRFLLRQAEDRIINRDQVVVPIMRFRHNHVVSEEVEGFRLDAMGNANLHRVTLRHQ